LQFVIADLKLKNKWLRIICWIVALVFAALIDSRCARSVRQSGLEHYVFEHDVLKAVLKSPGTYYFTVTIATIVAFLHRTRWRAGLFVLLATAGISALNGAVKWMVGRYRPFKAPVGSGQLAPFEFHPFPHESTNLCFPSGHACLAFATAAALGILWPRWRAAFYAGAILVAFERVAENAHWLSDCIAAAALGIGGVFLIRHLNDRFALLIPRDPLLQRAGKRERASLAG